METDALDCVVHQRKMRTDIVLLHMELVCIQQSKSILRNKPCITYTMVHIAQNSSYPKFQNILSVQNLPQHQMDFLGAGWFEMGILSQKTKEQYQSMPKLTSGEKHEKIYF